MIKLVKKIIVYSSHHIKMIIWRIEYLIYYKNMKNKIYNSPITKIIHQIWIGDNKMTKSHIHNTNTWIENNPGWKYILWNESNIIEFSLPDFYNDLPSLSSKSDILRYLIIQKYGGVYIDTDFECYKNIKSLLKEYTFVSSRETLGKGIAPGFFASTKHHPVLNLIVDNLKERNIKMFKDKIKGILKNDAETYGPHFFSEQINKFLSENNQYKENIKILPHKYLYPTINLENLYNIKIKDKKKYPLAYAYHKWEKSWQKK